MIQHRDLESLQAAYDQLDPSPHNEGAIEMIVCRPQQGERRVLSEAHLSVENGLTGDNWQQRGSSKTEDGSAHPDMQITLMNSRIIALIAGERENWPAAGDQFFVNFDLSAENLPAGTQVALGEAILQISEIPHTGCAKFTERYGKGAIRFVNSPVGLQQRRRGVNARIIKGGVVRSGDRIRKL